ncbi:MAG: DUF3192 domain-containing protein [Shewanella sp.]|nr:DUF3192 domain-containing protein [Shewanella sp.]
MKKNLAAIMALGISSLVLSGCVINVGDGEHDKNNMHPQGWEHAQAENRKHIEELRLGMNKHQVLDLMGRPDINEAFLIQKSTSENEDEAGQEVQVLFYRTQHNSGDGKTTKDECTPLVFKAGKLIGWGDKAYRYVH